MDTELMKKLFYFSVAILLSIILVWFGSQFMFSTGSRLNTLGMVIIGTLLVVGGICLLSVPSLWQYWYIGATPIVIGFYYFARAAGVVEDPWLAKVIGAASWAAAAILIYLTWPTRKTKQPVPPQAPEA